MYRGLLGIPSSNPPSSNPPLPVGLLRGEVTVASTSGTALDFLNLPLWARRYVLGFKGVSTPGGNAYLIQSGSGSLVTTGYSAGCCLLYGSNLCEYNASTAGFNITTSAAANIIEGSYNFNLDSAFRLSGQSGLSNNTGLAFSIFGGGGITLSGVPDRFRVTTIGGTDTFDAGSITLQYWNN